MNFEIIEKLTTAEIIELIYKQDIYLLEIFNIDTA
jgi:hypothetical protein